MNKKSDNGKENNIIRPLQINPQKPTTTVMVYIGPLNIIGLPMTGKSTK